MADKSYYVIPLRYMVNDKDIGIMLLNKEYEKYTYDEFKEKYVDTNDFLYTQQSIYIISEKFLYNDLYTSKVGVPKNIVAKLNNSKKEGLFLISRALEAYLDEKGA